MPQVLATLEIRQHMAFASDIPAWPDKPGHIQGTERGTPSVAPDIPFAGDNPEILEPRDTRQAWEPRNPARRAQVGNPEIPQAEILE